MDRITKQLKEIESELEQRADDAALWMERGVGYHLLGEYRQAEKSFRHSLRLENGSALCHYNLANTLLELEEYHNAIHHYLEAIERKPEHIPSLNNLADAYEQSGQSEKSREIFRYLVHLNPDDPLSHFNLGNFFLRNNQHTEAAGCYEKTLSMDDTFVDAWYNIAWILKQVEARSEALSYARNGLAVDPDHEDLAALVRELEK